MTVGECSRINGFGINPTQMLYKRYSNWESVGLGLSMSLATMMSFCDHLSHLGLVLVKLVQFHQIEHIGIDNNRYLVIHGDIFDGISAIAPWLSVIGDKGYDLILILNNKFNWVRRKLGFGYWSLSAYIKSKVKSAVSFVFEFETNIIEYCRKRGFGGIICGHIHQSEIKEIDGLMYMNDGDWVESMTALVENYDGSWEIITWSEII